MTARSKNAKPVQPATADLGDNVEESPWVSPEVTAMLEGEVFEINQDIVDLAPVTPYVAPDEDDAQDA
jgi:hypothetical protein